MKISSFWICFVNLTEANAKSSEAYQSEEDTTLTYAASALLLFWSHFGIEIWIFLLHRPNELATKIPQN